MKRGGEDLASSSLPLIPSVLPPADVQKESKENQWLGVSVRSQGPGGKIVVSTTSVMVCQVCVCVHGKNAEMCLQNTGWAFV